MSRVGVAGLALFAAVGVSVPAQAGTAHPAIDVRSCTGNQTPPIEFYDTSTQWCVGGTVGPIGVARNAFTMHSGGYYGDFEYIATDGSDHVVDFRPDEVHGIGGESLVVTVTITPPY